MKLTSVVFTILLLLVRAHETHAQTTYDGCTDSRGIRVASIVDYSLNDVANASLDPYGAPIIRYNPRILSWMHAQTRLFFYAHECGHHVRGHAFGSVHPLNMEQDADCFAIVTLVNDGSLSDDDVGIVQSDIAAAGRGDWTHLPGPQRAVNLRRCLKESGRSPRFEPRPTAPLACCDVYGRKWCPILVNPGPIGSSCYCNGVPGSGFICQ
jgi:hypothetical protein